LCPAAVYSEGRILRFHYLDHLASHRSFCQRTAVPPRHKKGSFSFFSELKCYNYVYLVSHYSILEVLKNLRILTFFCFINNIRIKLI
jgi:hypothetical protein